MTEGSVSPTGRPVVLAIDPGRSKCGLALVDDQDAIVHREIVLSPYLPEVLQDICPRYRPEAVVIGNGTGSASVHDAVRFLSLGCPVSLVEECYTSEAARKRYVEEIPAKGWRRLLPRALRTPEEPYDDFVAVILAERWWRSQREKIG